MLIRASSCRHDREYVSYKAYSVQNNAIGKSRYRSFTNEIALHFFEHRFGEFQTKYFSISSCNSVPYHSQTIALTESQFKDQAI